ncbi:MAG: hypothetical protein OXI66_15210 [Boseongicola sp.]|nr:hypothetical protein [Boseongicola sp.]
MEHDEALIKRILEWRASVQMAGPVPVPDFEGWSRAEVCHHVALCADAGFLSLGVEVGMLTWAGQQELERRSRSVRPAGSDRIAAA